MPSERSLAIVPPILLTANGGTEGQLTLTTTLGLFVKQRVVLQAPLISPLNVEIKYVINNTQVLVGPIGLSLNHRVDVSAYTVAASSFLFAGAQPKAVLSMEERLYASYIQEPSNSWRVTPVDSFGNSINDTNPLPVAFDGTISIGDVHIIGPSPDDNELLVNSDGSINVVVQDSVSSSTINQYQEASAVVYGITATIITYTAQSGFNTFLQKSAVSGENIALYQVLLNSEPVDTRRTYWGNLNSEFNFMTDSASGGYPLNPGDIISVTVLNYSPSQGTASFNSRIQLVTIPI